jgi:two-component system secretion response regulator SsrB
MIPITVSITDDHPIAIEGIQNMLRSAPDIVIANAYNSGESLLRGLVEEQPDVLLLDILLPDHNGADLAVIISKAYPKIRIIAISSLDAPIHLRNMMRQGCKGYILKNTDKTSLVDAIKQVYMGAEYIDPSLKEKMLHHVLHYQKLGTGKSPDLTQREKEILKLIVDELTCQEIASKLFLSLRTVETHRFNLQKKLGVHNNIGLVKIAIQMGLVSS